jgi:FtsP/CotA-like multicopper oxidase with cupredoxin domain
MSESDSHRDLTELLKDGRGSRRSFLKTGAATALASAALAACKPTAQQAPAAAVADSGHAAMTDSAAAHAASETMDAMHEKGVKAFPAKTAGQGNQLLAPTMDGKVKVFNLTASPVKWEVSPGTTVDAFAYNGQVPGPQIRIKEGDRVRIILKNELNESTAIHWHGVEVPNDMDGVPYITQKPVKPGQSFTYEFTTRNSGSHMYHSHHNSTMQVGKGLLGAFIIEPKVPRAIEKSDIDYVMIINDSSGGFTLNGKGFPATEPIVCKKGQRVRIRFMNEGQMIHPMHLHGMGMLVIDKDGYPQPMPWMCDTLNVAPGERWDVIVNAQAVGTWAFHCHILSHAESQMGMFGMVTALIIQP